MFDNVFDDKQWKTARDKAGLKSGLTEKVSMGDEFKRFQKDKTAAAAKSLLQKVALYEKQLKDKHAKEKYYASLLKVVQGQKSAIEAGIEAAERPVDKIDKGDKVGNGDKVSKVDEGISKKEMDQLADEIVEREKEHLRGYENTTNDPNVPTSPEAKFVYLKLIKEFKTVEEKMKSDRAAVTQLLQKCKTLETHPQLKTKPEVAVDVAQKIVETVNKIETKSFELHMDFVNEAGVVRKKEGRETGATKELDRMMARLKEESDPIADTSHACRLALKKALQTLGSNPKAQELLGRLGV